MAAGQYYVVTENGKPILYGDAGSGFVKIGNAQTNLQAQAYLSGTKVDPVTKQPLAQQPQGAGIQQQAQSPSQGNPAAKDTAVQPVTPDVSDLGGNSSKRYPNDIGFGSSDYMIFDFYNYQPPFRKITGQATSLEAYNSSANQNNLEKDGSLNQIILYMPEGISASYKANWDGKKFGNIAAGILAGAGDVTSGKMVDALSKLGSTASTTAQRAPAQLGAAAVSAIIQGITGDSVGSNDVFSAVGGQILNPNAELIFGGHDLRTFTFTYKLVPYNDTEAGIIFGKKGIISTFKRAMLPSFGKSDTAPATAFTTNSNALNQPVGFIQNPKLVQINFMCGNEPHPYLPKFKPCTITDFDVNYTADGVYAAHANGYPAAAEITISFTETKLIYAEDIANGF